MSIESPHQLQRIVLNIRTENAAYEEEPVTELDHNFTRVIRSMGGSSKASLLYSTHLIRDSNGNVVGQAQGVGMGCKTCPSCGWVMVEIDEAINRYACRNCNETWMKK